MKKYFNKINEKEICKIIKIVKILENENTTYEDYDNNKLYISNLLDLKEKANQVDKIKNLYLFDIIYKNTKGKDQNEHFNIALQKLKNIKSIYKSNNENDKNLLAKIKKENIHIEKEIKEYDEKIFDNELSLLINFDSYESDIKSIFYFFDNLYKDENWNKILFP